MILKIWFFDCLKIYCKLIDPFKLIDWIRFGLKILIFLFIIWNHFFENHFFVSNQTLQKTVSENLNLSKHCFEYKKRSKFSETETCQLICIQIFFLSNSLSFAPFFPFLANFFSSVSVLSLSLFVPFLSLLCHFSMWMKEWIKQLKGVSHKRKEFLHWFVRIVGVAEKWKEKWK